MPTLPSLRYHFEPWEIFGGRRALFVRYAHLVADVIKDFKLQPIKEDILVPTMRFSGATRAVPDAEMLAQIDPGICGGKRFAHLHFRGDVYQLDVKQWQTFTARVTADLAERVQAAGAVSVEQILDLSDAVDAIG